MQHFEHGKYFPTGLAQSCDKGSGRFLIHLTSYVQPLFIRWLLLSPVRSTPMVQDRSAYWCPVVQSPQEMLGLTFLHDFSSEVKDAGGCEKRQLLFSRDCASLPSFCRTSRPGWVSGLQISFPSRDGVSLLTACEQQNTVQGYCTLSKLSLARCSVQELGKMYLLPCLLVCRWNKTQPMGREYNALMHILTSLLSLHHQHHSISP